MGRKVSGDVLDRILRHLDLSEDCWVWTGYRDPRRNQGYGKVKVDGQNRPVHRVLYELVVEPVPSGLDIDHLCRNRACVNPDHLEPVTRRVNLLRGNTIAAANARKTRCPSGHSLEGPNLYLRPDGRRECHTCRKAKPHR